MNTEMTWHTKKIHYREKSYHAVGEFFGISWLSLIEWKLLCEDLRQSIVSYAIRHEVCWSTHSCVLPVVEARPERERERERETNLNIAGQKKCKLEPVSKYFSIYCRIVTDDCYVNNRLVDEGKHRSTTRLKCGTFCCFILFHSVIEDVEIRGIE